ncbi:NAD(P)/FAD-dependent oxidoreductase [Myxococcota bacterium]|nr:NAD(P)/FAD-dependent oxidoreductase [Myxococcota bacterium]MCZ7619805.1 NAD(P)/FAD-dependent oxidoreductase [Myxococcota bacterium]
MNAPRSTASDSPGSVRATGSREFPIAILGAGFGGIGMAIQLRKAGIDSFTLFERADEIGGTWRDNTYPGAACDVPSHAYSLSFEQYPGWRRKFSPADEIQAYLLRLVEKWKLRDHLRLGTEIVEARFDEAAGRWTLRTQGGESVHARAVVSAVGGLVDPALPDIPGLESFRGERFHTARWNHDYDLTGRRVGVIGTGASAVQVVPSIAPQVARLTVFQRTPGWVVPKRDAVYSDRTRKLLARMPGLLHLSRGFQYWMSELFGPIVFLDAPRLSAIGERLSLAHLRAQVKDPVLRAKLRPDFQFGCKRILISDDYWASFERDNVELVCDGIEEIVPEGIRTRDGTRYELDALILATGFQLGLAKAPFPIYGRHGRSLDEDWSTGAVAYKGLAISGYPNWFLLMGPNTGPGHTSVLVYTEAQIRHAVAAIRALRDQQLRYVDVRRDVQDRYNQQIQRRMQHMVWPTCHSWYLSPDGTNHSLYPGFAFEYVLGARRFQPREYELARFDGFTAPSQ